MAAVLVIASACWTSCGGSGGGGGGGFTPPPGTPPAPPLPTSSAGWTELTPSADTLTVYVSDSDGDDANDGLSEAAPKATLSAGKALMRTGMPDWLLLKAGDTWTDQDFGNWNKSGRSSTELMVITSYGTGARPRVRTGTDNGFSMLNVTIAHVALIGIHLEAHLFTGTQACAGVLLLTTIDDVLIEDCLIQAFKDNFVMQANNGPGTLTNVRLRRCVIVDAYSGNSAHAQGIYAAGLENFLIEECVFDHNGWTEDGSGPATMFNHNIYVDACSDVIVRGNLFLRASSMNNKFNCDFTGGSRDILIENNFYIEGEIAIGIGGNTTDPLRFVNVTIRDNVMMQVGRTQPTNRDLAWYIEVEDWDGGLIENNLMLHQSLLENSFGVSLGGGSDRNTTIRDNVFYGLMGRSVLIDIDPGETGIVVQDNEMQDPTEASELIDISGSLSAVTFSGNSYFSNAALSAWFRIGGSLENHADWVAGTGETGSTTGAVSYPDPNRDETTYQASLGGAPTLDAFAAEARLQSKAFWRPAYTADGINDYIRAGFGR
jgi:hypothetical protein